MALYRTIHEEYEKSIRMGHPSGPRAKTEDAKDTPQPITNIPIIKVPVKESSPMKKKQKLKK
jgi:hypothetical protein